MAEISEAIGLADTRQGRAVVPFDFDNDGDLDLLIVNMGDRVRLWRNDGGERNAWLRVQLRGPGPNPFGIGARVDVQAAEGGPSLRRDITGNSAFVGFPAPEAHFGLGNASGPLYQVRVTWPGQTEPQVLEGVAPRQVLRVSPP
jgi:hypothetical protein